MGAVLTKKTRTGPPPTLKGGLVNSSSRKNRKHPLELGGCSRCEVYDSSVSLAQLYRAEVLKSSRPEKPSILTCTL